MEAKGAGSGGRFLPRRPRALGRWILVLVLLTWDGLLLYMIGCCLIQPVYGGTFVAVVSIYLGVQLQEV